MPKTPEIGCELNMTPMIDVVFQLIIFFMLVTEMSQADLESMDLPDASMALPDDSREKRLVVNVTGTGDLRVRGRTFDPKALEDWLAREAEAAGRGSEDARVCDVPLLIRADRDAEFKYVQHIMQGCARPGVGIWKILIASKEPKKD